MYIKQNINVYQFRDMFAQWGRRNEFSYEALGILFDYLEDYSEHMGEPLELDIVALCCEYDEMSWQEAASDYRIDLSDCEDDDERVEVIREYLQDNTSVCGEFTNDHGHVVFVFQVF